MQGAKKSTFPLQCLRISLNHALQNNPMEAPESGLIRILTRHAYDSESAWKLTTHDVINVALRANVNGSWECWKGSQ